MTEILRIALLGGGKMAAQHAVAIQYCDSVKLVAVVDPGVAEQELKQRFGATVACYADAAAMLEQVRPDVVHVVTPPQTHAALARLCLEAGAHVYVEKPFALTLAETEPVLALADERGLRACAAHQVRFQDAGRRYRQFLPMIGQPIHVESFFSFKPVRRRAGGGGLNTPVDQLIDILPHPVYLLLDALRAGGAADAELGAFEVSADGEVRAVVRSGDTLGTLVVSLRARPVESFLRVMGTNGSVNADFILSAVVQLPGPGASAPSVVVKPFSAAWQQAWGSFKGLFGMVFRRHKSYPGLAELLGEFYESVRKGTPGPVSHAEIRDTVRICEAVSQQLREAERGAERLAEADYRAREAALVRAEPTRGTVLLTGGSGLLGRRTATVLRDAGWRVRVPVRREIPFAQRSAGVEYVAADLGVSVPEGLLDGVDVVIHAAAETAGGLADHERNTVVATRHLLDAMAAAGVRRLVNIGSVAVLKPAGAGRALTEDSPVDVENLGRGPYVWAKAEAERMAEACAQEGRIDLRTVRLGPLVDYDDYTPPGRLGREVVRLFVGMGGRRKALSVCSVGTAAEVLRHYAEAFDSTPQRLNLLEVPAPTRGELFDRLRAKRPDLKILWLPFPVLRLLSLLAIGLQKVLHPSKPSLDLYAAFKSESYDPTLAEKVITESRSASDRIMY
jgi:predicted dehydrogenase/nucleoside-diphosphate-sugar epimerase